MNSLKDFQYLVQQGKEHVQSIEQDIGTFIIVKCIIKQTRSLFQVIIQKLDLQKKFEIRISYSNVPARFPQKNEQVIPTLRKVKK